MLHFYYFITSGITQIILLPFWWYSRGLSVVLTKLAEWQLIEWRQLGLWTWLRNLLTPMFHDYTIIGRGLSFVMRVIMIIIKIVNLLVKFAFKVVLIILWLVLPLLVVYGSINVIFF